MMGAPDDGLPGLPYESAHVSVRQVPGEAILILERTEAPLPDEEQALDEAFLRFVRVLRSLPREALHLIIDTRRSPGRNDAVFERIQAKYRADIFTAFQSVSVVLASVVGRMQVARYEREAGHPDYGHFASLEEAIASLTGGDPPA